MFDYQLMMCTFYFYKLCYQERQCNTPSRASGNCVSIRQCPTLLNLLAGSVTTSNREFLRQSQCGYENRQPLVK